MPELEITIAIFDCFADRLKQDVAFGMSFEPEDEAAMTVTCTSEGSYVYDAHAEKAGCYFVVTAVRRIMSVVHCIARFPRLVRECLGMIRGMRIQNCIVMRI